MQEMTEDLPFWVEEITKDEGHVCLPKEQEVRNHHPEKEEETGGKKKKAEESNTTAGKGEKNKKKNQKKNLTDKLTLPTTSSSANDGTAALSATSELNDQCDKYEILRMNYKQLRHNYAHIRRRCELAEKSVQKMIEKSSEYRREKRAITDEEGVQLDENGVGGGGGAVGGGKRKQKLMNEEEDWGMVLLKL